jgi:serine/threonine protein kinase
MKFVYTTGARPLDGYTIKRGVGVGGFGEVYFATSDAGKEVALKRVQRNLDVEVRGVTQCLNLKHPNLIAIYDIKYDDQGEGWIVMEFVSGESLKDVTDRNPNGMPIEEVNFWFTGIAAGVAYLHDHGIVHRDLKPGNIFIDENVVKIGDYGLSKFISCSRRSGQTESVGTFHYMAPEIGKGVYGKEIDIYALGIILFEMLTGGVPFEGESSQEIIMKHLTADPDLSGVPLRYRRVIERALFKDPAKRFASVSEMLRSLQLGEDNVPSKSIPPVVIPTAEAEPEGPIYINEDGVTSDDIVFGPVVEVVSAAADNANVPPVTIGTDSDEPIEIAVRRGYRRTLDWWHNTKLNTPVKIALLVIGIILLLVASEVLIPVGIVLGAMYVVYRAVRLVMRSNRRTPTTDPDFSRNQLVSTTYHEQRHRRRAERVSWQEEARRQLRRRTASERLTELTGSFLMSAIVSAVLGLIILLAAGHSLDGSVNSLSLYAWITVSSIAGSWIILGLSKLWEGSEGDEVRRRFAMMVAGLVMGVLCYAASELLMLQLSRGEMFNVLEMPNSIIPTSMYFTDGAPRITAFLAFFATIFALLRWWRPVDPLRRTRFSLWATIVCVFWGLLIPWQVPWGFLLVATISVASQISAPYMNKSERSRVRRELLEA